MNRSTAIAATLLATLLVLFSGCGFLSGEDDRTIRASGTVVSAETGAPIEGITVALGQAKIVTSAPSTSG